MNFKTFFIGEYQVTYRETVPEDDCAFEKVYLLENPGRCDIIAIPDGCVDIQFVWRNGDCRGYICGSFLQGGWSSVSLYERVLGLKIRPGYRFLFMPESAKIFMASRLLLADFLDVSALESALVRTEDFAEQTELCLAFFRGFETAAPDAIAESAAGMILSDPAVAQVSRISDTLGYSQHHINNVFKTDFGVPVKQYSGIIRMQNAIEQLRSEDIMDVVTGLGYYDQAHFIHDFKRYTSLTPGSFLDSDRSAGGRSIV